MEDTWAQMVSYQEQRLKLCEQSIFFAISLPKMIPSPVIKSIIINQSVTWTDVKLLPERFAKGLFSVTLQPSHLTDRAKRKIRGL